MDQSPASPAPSNEEVNQHDQGKKISIISFFVYESIKYSAVRPRKCMKNIDSHVWFQNSFI